MVKNVKTKTKGALDDLVEVLGPYEKWMNDRGKFYDYPSDLMKNKARLSSVGEHIVIPLNLDISNQSFHLSNSDKFESIIFPLLWNDEFNETKFAPNFLPLVLDTGDKKLSFREISSSDISSSLMRTSSIFIPPVRVNI